jgi:hypothetical protein
VFEPGNDALTIQFQKLVDHEESLKQLYEMSNG